jgi:hypothetical protein
VNQNKKNDKARIICVQDQSNQADAHTQSVQPTNSDRLPKKKKKKKKQKNPIEKINDLRPGTD